MSTVKYYAMSISDGQSLNSLCSGFGAQTAVGLSCRGSEVSGAREGGGGWALESGGRKMGPPLGFSAQTESVPRKELDSKMLAQENS